MRRFLLPTFFVVATIGCGSLSFLWMRSFTRADTFYLRVTSDQVLGVGIDHGGVVAGHQVLSAMTDPEDIAETDPEEIAEAEHPFASRFGWLSDDAGVRYPMGTLKTRFWNRLGFGIQTGEDYQQVILPAWCVVLSAGLMATFLGAGVYRRRRRGRRLRSGHCVVCDYDLRGSNDRCPECGTERSKQPLAAG